MNKARPDWWILVACLGLLALGLIMVFSSSAYVAAYEQNDAFFYLRAQGVAAVLGLVGMFLAYYIRMRHLRWLAWQIGRAHV
jgi:cell division protein FtsW